ncbi:Putative F-box domain, JmjC domain, F-box-like domain superfamily protein [Colletotrichum destructivum]|uniref:F-box domain, JmjC domain, F-box-like domain superfamily protein n=1 Tax=Colletotrichum destructivum TaxID=34406 RepID=A0AAX4I3R9_9PEZI|nr:Putative F-box domain, JmjC domain, F-box-like domain superfamily protein [Colletotrichum destructivum]
MVNNTLVPPQGTLSNGRANGYADNANHLEYDSNPVENAAISAESIPTHPLGVKPLGNQYLSGRPNARKHIGVFKILPDEALMILLDYLDQDRLRKLGSTCKFLHASCRSDDLWKSLFLQSRSSGRFDGKWRGTWRATQLGLSSEQESKIDCSNVFSDVLHRPFVCSHVDLKQFTSRIPRTNLIQRMETLTYNEFSDKWTETPFVLTNYIQAWPVYHGWTMDVISKRYGNIEFRAEAVDWPFSTYHDYMENNDDESPLYLFDKKFAEKMEIKVGAEEGAAYWKPECFGPDLFELLGEERPAHRWLIIGPERSGSTFHKDPNGTSAWNAVIRGAKYWIMFPPTASVPGVYVSQDSSEVTSPLSIAEWLLEFHAEARQLPECIEGICNEGEILHVPSGWWHLVVNLESGIALTQNFVPKSQLSEVVSFLRDKADQVTGFKQDVTDPHGLFVERLRQDQPDLLEETLQVLEKRNTQKKRKWEDAVGGGDTKTNEGGFSFGFGGDLEDEEVP